MQLAFRQAIEQDTEEILKMMKVYNAIDAYHFDAEITRLTLKEFISNKQLGRMWLITADDQTIGYIALTFGFSFEFKGLDAFIDELFLKESFRRKGIGGQAIDFICQQAQELKIKALHLEVEKHNPSANKLYLNKGFKEHNRILMTKFVT